MIGSDDWILDTSYSGGNCINERRFQGRKVRCHCQCFVVCDKTRLPLTWILHLNYYRHLTIFFQPDLITAKIKIPDRPRAYSY